MKLWEKCLGEYSGCASGYVFIGKEFAMDVEVLDVLAGIPEHRVDKGALKAYIQNSPENHLTHFWTTQSVDSEDAFWVQLINQRTEWIGGQEDSGSVWYLAWKAQSEFNAGHAKYAYQWGLSAIQIFPKYTRMYELLAESAKLLGRDPRPFWTQYLQQDPKTSRLAEARKAVEG
jgi:hypothetical protein